MRRLLAALVAAPLFAGGLVVVTPAAPAEAGQVMKIRLYRAIKKLPVAAETRRGYDRAKFRHWIDADRDCRDTRDEVLAAESRVSVRGCDVRRGKWFSYYDRRTYIWSSKLDVDHLVPLAEAWDSGAKRWNVGTRKRFANDLGDRRSLVAVTASVNRSKSDQDASEWMPRYGKCRYVREWTAVKTRWSLKVDRAERRALLRRASKCKNVVLRVRKAHVGTRSTSGGGGSGGTDPKFDYCYQAIEAGYGPYVKGEDDEYYWYTDADADGVVCES